MTAKNDHNDVTVQEYIKKILMEFRAFQSICDLERLEAGLKVCGSWQELDRALCEIIYFWRPTLLSDDQRTAMPPEDLDKLEKHNERIEFERRFWEKKREEISEISGIGRVAQPPHYEPVKAPLDEVDTKRLTRHQKDRLDSLKNTPGADEFGFFKHLIGLTPAKARLTMAEEYARRFSPNLTLEEIVKGLGPGKTWRDLDLGITLFLKARHKFYELLVHPAEAKAVYGGLSSELIQQYDLEVDFWDRMRLLIHSLPRPREFSNKYQSRSSLGEKRPAKGWSYETCQLCWRTVPYNSAALSKNGILCFLHDLPSDDPTYRKHKRLADSVHVHYSKVLKPLKECFPRGIPDEAVMPVMMRILTTDGTPLPKLAEYLTQVGHDGTPEALLRAFHGPFPVDDLPKFYSAAIDEFFQWAMGFPYLFTLDELCLAESWLTSLQIDRRKKT